MAEATWTIRSCLDWTRGYLERKGDEKARLAAEWLLTAATGLSRVQLYVNYDRPLSPAELEKMHAMIKRRSTGEPLQYIIGETSFRTINVACAPGVLIPRPETEMLVDEVLAYLDKHVLAARQGAQRERKVLAWNTEVAEQIAAEQERSVAAEAAPAPAALIQAATSEASGGDEDDEDENRPVTATFGASGSALDEPDAQAAVPPQGEGPAAEVAGEAFAAEASADDAAQEAEPDPEPAPAPVARVVEVGCGTGCIGLSLAVERPGDVRVLEIDIAPEACALTRANRDALDLAGAVAIRQGDLLSPVRPAEQGTFDVLVSNPPYIPSAVMRELPHEVADFEPALALAGGDDGLDVFRRLVDAAPGVLKPGGFFACELHETTLGQAAQICRAAGFAEVRIVRDLPGKPRFVTARMPHAAQEDARQASAQQAAGR